MGMELNKMRHGQKTDVHMSEKQLRDYAGTKTKGLPMKVKPKTKSKKLKGAAGGVALSDGAYPAGGGVNGEDWTDAVGNGGSAMGGPAPAAATPVAAGGGPMVSAPVIVPPSVTQTTTRSTQGSRGASVFPFGGTAAPGSWDARNAAPGTQGVPAYTAPNWMDHLAAIYGRQFGSGGSNIRAGLDQMRSY